MNYTIIKCLLLSFILFANNFQALACFFNSIYKFEVHVVNNLPPNTEPLLLHCASKDDDLGNHTLTLNQDFHFQFCLKPLFTLFFCRLRWGKKNKSFDVFNARWVPVIPCTHHQCYWAAKSDGIYFSGSYPPDKLVKKYDWE
ncbi:hypothetical protein Pfo_027142 [Paulownia fortunei]|nr:hypothetical protein Pfo_027142 [Paulownia fortunei]